ncbi:MAG: cation:proton antiporter [Candidatus Paceibacterota bacterium]
MTQLLPFFLILFASVFFSELFNRLHLPWVIALIIAGMFIGPFGLGFFTPTDTINFLSEVGLVFLMFMAGLETRLSSFQKDKFRISLLAFFNGALPFVVGFGIGQLFAYGFYTSLLLGIIFVSSSLAVVIPSLEKTKVLHTPFGQVVIATTILQDVASLILLSVFFQSVDPITTIPLPVFYTLVIGFLAFLRYIIPKIHSQFVQKFGRQEDIFQQELRFIFVILFGIVVAFELLGLHAIIAGFFAGFVLSGTINNEILKGKLRAISYGIFIPVFFVVVGANTDLTVFGDLQTVGLLTLTVVAGSVISKYVSGAFGGRLLGFSIAESRLLGASSIPQLSTTLAVVFSAQQMGIIPSEVTTAMVILSIVTTFISPELLRILSKPPSAQQS